MSQEGDTGGTGTVKKTSTSKPMINVAYPPLMFWDLLVKHVTKEGIAQEEFTKRGFEGVKFQGTWKDVTLFASGKTRISHGNSLETLAGAMENDFKMVYGGQVASAMEGWLTRTGGKYDPATTGSVQESLQKVADDNATIGIPSWSSGSVTITRLTLSNVFGLELKPDGGDFKNVQVIGSYAQVPKQVAKGNLAMGLGEPALGALPYLMGNNPELTAIYWDRNVWGDRGFGSPTLSNIGMKKKDVEAFPKLLEAYVTTWEKGNKWLFEKAQSGELASIAMDWDTQGMSAQNEAEAQFLIDWYMLANKAVKYEMFQQDVTYTDNLIEQEKRYLRLADDYDVLNQGWEEYGTFKKVPGLS